MRALTDGMPSSRVAISLKTRYHRDGRHRGTANDIHDIGALAVAVPYCDAALTDRAARSALAASREIRPLGTFLPRRPRELADWIGDLPPRQHPDPRNLTAVSQTDGTAPDKGRLYWMHDGPDDLRIRTLTD